MISLYLLTSFVSISTAYHSTARAYRQPQQLHNDANGPKHKHNPMYSLTIFLAEATEISSLHLHQTPLLQCCPFSTGSSFYISQSHPILFCTTSFPSWIFYRLPIYPLVLHVSCPMHHRHALATCPCFFIFLQPPSNSTVFLVNFLSTIMSNIDLKPQEAAKWFGIGVRQKKDARWVGKKVKASQRVSEREGVKNDEEIRNFKWNEKFEKVIDV